MSTKACVKLYIHNNGNRQYYCRCAKPYFGVIAKVKLEALALPDAPVLETTRWNYYFYYYMPFYNLHKRKDQVVLVSTKPGL